MNRNFTTVALLPLLVALIYLIVTVLLAAFEAETNMTIKSAGFLILAALVWIFACAVYHVLCKGAN